MSRGDMLVHPQDDSLWGKVLGGLGEEWRLVAGEPEDLSRN